MAILYNRVYELCEKQGINITQMCYITKIPRSTFSDYKTGRKKSIGTRHIEMVADFFSVTTDYLLGRTDDPTPKSDTNINDVDLKIAFWGNPDEDDELLADVKSYAQYIKERKKAQDKKDEKFD